MIISKISHTLYFCILQSFICKNVGKVYGEKYKIIFKEYFKYIPILQSGILMKLYFLDKVYKELRNILLLTYKKEKKTQHKQIQFLSELYSLASCQSMQNTNFFSMIQDDNNFHMQLNTLQYTTPHDLLIEMVICILILNGPILFCFLTQSTFHSFNAFSSCVFFFASDTYFSAHSAYLLKATLSLF